jgi:anti-sigma regulatory factor (Ser/Thr protein kinase)
LLYDGDGSYLAGTVPFIRDGLRAGEPIMVAVGAERIELLTEVLGPDADAVCFADMAELGANPARIIPAWHSFLEAEGEPGRAIRGIGEPIWAGRTPDELTECQLHEALLNVAFRGADGFRLLCPYDAAALPSGVVREARCSHPVVVQGVERSWSPDYRGRDGVPPQSEAPLPPPPLGARSLGFDADTLTDVRELVQTCGETAGLDDEQVNELVLAVHELASNSILHGGGIGVARAWHDDGAAVCEVRDRGRFDDPLAGRRPPRPDQLGGWGLWIANHACDLVQVRTGPAGTTVRVRMRAL